MAERPSDIRVGFYTSSGSWPNHQRWHYHTARELFERGYAVQVITPSGGRLTARTVRQGIEVERFRKKRFFLLDIIRLALMLKRSGITTLLINYPNDLRLAAVAARLAGVRRVIFRQGTVSHIRTNPLNHFVLHYFVDTVVTNSRANRRKMLREKGKLFSPESTQVIYNGIDLSRKKFAGHHLSNIRNNGELMVGLISHDLNPSGIRELLETIRREQDHPGDIRLLIHGNVRSLREVKQRLKRAVSLQELVEWDSGSTSLMEFMSHVDVFLTGRVRDGFNHPLVYAMIQNKPVIGFNEGSNPEIIRDDQNGYLLRKDDFQGIAMKLKKLRDEDLRKRLGREARQIIEKQFNIERTIDQLKELLR